MAEISTAPNTLSANDSKSILALPYDKFRRDILEPKVKWKERSENTHNSVHKPGLEAVAPTTGSQGTFALDVVYIGDSMLERLKTTGTSTSLHCNPYMTSFNLGVGGDKIENLLYRLHLGLCALLYTRPPKLFVLHIGTNNLTPRRGLRPAVEMQNYKLLLQTLLRLNSPEGKVLCTGLFERKDVPDEVVKGSNDEIRKMVDEVNGELKDGEGKERVFWMEPPSSVGKDVLVDHVHLSEEGYKLWDAELFKEVERLYSRV